MRVLAAVIATGLAAVTGVTAPPVSSAGDPTVPCGSTIGSTKWPYLGNSPGNRYRQVLGAVAVPPAYMRQVVPTHEKPWAYWHKQGLVVRAIQGSVTVTVPEEWRTRAAITWGNSGTVSSLRIESCGASANLGRAYAGGFLLRSPSACVPLIFAVGKRTATVRFGVGKACGA